MAIAAPTQLATVASNTATQSSMASGSIVFPTTGTAVLGLVTIAISGTATSETITCADNLGNTWTVVATANNVGTGGAHTAVAYFLYPSAGGSTTATVTVSWGTAVNERYGWFGYTTGHDTTTPFDASGTSIGTGSQTSTTITTSGNLAAANELGIYVFCVGGTTITGTPPSGWTLLEANPSDGVRSRVASFGYQVVSGGSGATLSAGAMTYTASSNTQPTGSIATFKAAGGSTKTIAVATTGVATPAFTPSGMTDPFTVATTGHSAPAFTLAGMTDTIAVATTGKATPAFGLAGMSDVFALAVAGSSVPSFGVSKSGGTVAIASDFPYASLGLLLGGD